MFSKKENELRTKNLGAVLDTVNDVNIAHSYTYGDSDWGDLLTAVDGQPITYDEVGNPLTFYDGYHYTFTWEEGRQLESVTSNNKTTSYQYDFNGIRTKKTNADGSYVVYDLVDGTAVGETRYNANNTVSLYMRYIFDEAGAVNGIGLWYSGDTAWTDYYFAKNLQGDVLEVYQAETHTLVAEYMYDAWGNVLWKSGTLADVNPFRYRSYYYDTETTLYYLQSRYYDPAIGRFINADSFISTGQGILGNNMFAYCGNSPLVYVDHSGLRQVPAMKGLSMQPLQGEEGRHWCSELRVPNAIRANGVKEIVEITVAFGKKVVQSDTFQDTAAVPQVALGIIKMIKSVISIVTPDPIPVIDELKNGYNFIQSLKKVFGGIIEFFDWEDG